ncbi:four-domain proteases inhibitor-like [Liolophura sinensis]|uniref:four-domain proteases inhibitor-like n=1 Tax=Liolophura sinensis TaxID=3198878 RepID=UPI00315820DD
MESFVVLSLLISAAFAQNIFKHCDYVQHLDCSTFTKEELCASNGKTYREQCSLAVDHCLDKSIHKVHNGPCSTHHHTTPGAILGGTTVTLVESVFCRALQHIDCSNHKKNTVCDSNGGRHESMCVYEKAKCENSGLHLKEC